MTSHDLSLESTILHSYGLVFLFVWIQILCTYLLQKKQALVIFLGSFSLFLFIAELKVPLTLISRVFAFLLFIDTNIFFWLNHVPWCMFNVNLKKYNTYRCLLILVLNMVTGVLSFLLGDIKCKKLRSKASKQISLIQHLI